MMIYTDKNIKWLRETAFALFAATLLSGCIKDELHNTPHPDKGAVWVATDWSGLSNEGVHPESYQLRVGELTHTVSGTDNAFKHLLNEGNHTMVIHTQPQGVAVGTETASVNTLPDGTLEPMPEYLFSAVSALSIVKDDTLKVNAKMLQSLRTLQLTLKLNTEDRERIASSIATLTGIAQTIDLATGQADVTGAGKVVAPTFVLSSVSPTRAEGQPALITLLRLAGVASDGRQVLTLLVTLKSGTVVSIAADLTDALKNFNKELEPLVLDATLVLPDGSTEAEISGTITDWIVIDNGNISIH